MYLQISSHTRPALAALLMVLSASVVFAQVKTVPFKGAFDGRDYADPTGHAQGFYTGTASHIGRFTFTGTVTIDLMTFHSTGTFQLVTMNGDVIYGTLVGKGEPPENNVAHIVEVMTITGGTGRFQGATGGFTFDRFDDLSTLPAYGSTSGSLTGIISSPSSTK